MNFIKRKVFLTKYLRPYDTNGDGVFNALVLSATTKTIQIPLTHSYDDMGVFEVSDEESIEIIDIGGVFDDKITGVTQPSKPITVINIDWSGGGSVGNGGTNDTDVKYCNDLTAINGTTLTFISGGDAVLNPNNEPPTTYESPLPTFTIDNSLCQYEQVIGDLNTGDTGGSNVSNEICIVSSLGHGNSSHVTTTVQPRFITAQNGTCNASWFDFSPWDVKPTWTQYQSKALSNALDYCQSLGLGYTRVLINSDFEYNGTTVPQGDPINDPTQPWAGVKLKSSTSGQCCAARNNDNECVSNLTGYWYNFCFFCSK